MRKKTHVIVSREDFDKAIAGLVADEADFSVQSLLVKVGSVQLNGTSLASAKSEVAAPAPAPAKAAAKKSKKKSEPVVAAEAPAKTETGSKE